MRNAALLVIPLVLLGACDRDRLRPDVSELRAIPDSLQWEKGWVGYATAQKLQLENTGRVTRAVHLTAASPFSVAEPDLEVPGGSRIEVEIRFTPEQPGEASGSLEVSSDSMQLRVPLSGHALAVPDCGEEPTCHETGFDSSTGECVTTVLPDGTACSTPCVDSAFCQGGACLGTSTVCDDGNPCTLDGCDQDRGCIHVESTASCPSPAEPCRVAFCDPTTGCGVTNVVDGTSCGPADCVTSNVCLAGTCTVVSVPEGAACGVESPCQSQGICHDQQCLRTDPTPLVPVWSYMPADGVALTFPGVADAAGNLYWLECEENSCSLVSFTRAGLERFRVPLRGLRQTQTEGTIVLVGGSVAVAQQDVVQFFRASDGAELWFRDLKGDLILGSPANRHLNLGPIVDLGSGRIALCALSGGWQTSPIASWLVALSTSTGEISWTWEGNGVIHSLIAGVDGTSWLYDDPVASHAGLVSLSRDGVVLSDATVMAGAYGSPIATNGDRVILAGGGLVSTVTHAEFGKIGSYFVGANPTPLLGDGFAYSIANSYVDGWYMERFRSADGGKQWEARLDQMGTPSPPLSTETSQPVLTADEGVLVAKGDSGGRNWDLVKVSSEGTADFACHLPGTARYPDAAVLVNGRWTTVSQFNETSIVSFDVGNVALAPSGWTMVRGRPEGSGTPQ